MLGVIWVFDSQMVFLKDVLENVDFENNQQTTKNMKNFQGGRE